MKYSGCSDVSLGMSPAMFLGMSLRMSLGKRSGTFIQKLLIAGCGALDLFRSSSFNKLDNEFFIVISFHEQRYPLTYYFK